MSEHRHFILNKPFGYLSQFVYNQTKRRNKKLLGELHDFPDGTMSIGRLDKNSEGLLLLTTDGKVSYFVRSRKVEKEYLAQVEGEITEEAIENLKSGVEISIDGEKYVTDPCQVKAVDKIPDYIGPKDMGNRTTRWISITLREGKFRQVRKMTAMVGFRTLRLIRVRIGDTYLKDLEPGEVLEVSDFDI
ncbi:pseudouridine synthase [Fulvivirga maritima]|uniref:pseudouridine synthase n=1 Tax=Fulvivirga maritima TaxID=2904247 RepID=UPI001F2C011B|nr:pseudouridine synthase [Fulvivirga maritima]UII27361.1 pseudouridine synthase [Fulvivirga maritima]